MPQLEERDDESAIEQIADEHDRPITEYQYDGPIPEWDDLESVSVDDE